ncbi:MAG: elongation factor G, partial [Waddliaceae bacterium]|nr:elongation factor G [Waddliaceae bacterium]
FFRVYSGSLKAGSDLKNCTRGNNERLNQIFIMNGKERHDISELPAGAIAAAVKLKNAHTDDTLCDARNAIEYPKTVYPMPCITFAMEPKNKGAEDKFSKALGNMHAEDPTFSYRVDSETNQTLVFGMGELHIITIMDQIKERYNIDVALNKPKVPFRETIRGNSDSKFRHKKQSGGSGQFAEVWMRVAPQPSGEGINFTESLVGQNVDRGFVPSVEKGVNAICKEGVLAKCTVVDVKIDFYDGKMHPVDSNDMSFQLAGRGAFKEAFSKAQPYLLEPICTVEINTPDQFLGDVMGDISSRRGQVQGMDSDGHFQIVKAQIPQANLYKYSTALRSMTHGTAEHAEAFSHYAEMPRNIEQEVIGELHVEV